MQKENILIVDDQIEILKSLRRLLQPHFNVITADNGKSALEVVKSETLAVIISDQKMPEMDGVTFLTASREVQPDSTRIILTGYADIEATVEAVNKANIYQYIAKPFEPDDLIEAIKKASAVYQNKVESISKQSRLEAANVQLSHEKNQLQKQLETQFETNDLIASSPSMLRALDLAKKVSATPTTVLISGETGTGKELMAKIIHYNSPRKNEIFIAQNCAAIPDTLLQSELFGHSKGAFTGAVESKKGLFESADKGTIFLDEIGDTSPSFQLGLLRVLQEQEVKALGAIHSQQIDVRVIAATNRNLEQAVKEGKFRQDLYFRLAVFPIELPPLRDRADDFYELVTFFIKKYSQRIQKNIIGVDPATLKKMTRYAFPGNIRELENEVERMVTLANDDENLHPDLLSSKFHDKENSELMLQNEMNLKYAREKLERFLIDKALKQSKGNILKAAEILGLSRVGLHKMLTRYSISASFYK
jgi:two-component system response regulator HupR/HoxA